MSFSHQEAPEGYPEDGFEDVEREYGGDGLLECVQGAAVGGVEDSPGLEAYSTGV